MLYAMYIIYTFIGCVITMVSICSTMFDVHCAVIPGVAELSNIEEHMSDLWWMSTISIPGILNV